LFFDLFLPDINNALKISTLYLKIWDAGLRLKVQDLLWIALLAGLDLLLHSA
jgi:hypothetical protein